MFKRDQNQTLSQFYVKRLIRHSKKRIIPKLTQDETANLPQKQPPKTQDKKITKKTNNAFEIMMMNRNKFDSMKKVRKSITKYPPNHRRKSPYCSCKVCKDRELAKWRKKCHKC